MQLKKLALGVSLAAAVQGQNISWTQCPDIKATGPVCANFTVPLDYGDLSSNATVRLELLKVTARHTPSRGSIFFNFGGPGIPTRKALAALGQQLLKYYSPL